MSATWASPSVHRLHVAADVPRDAATALHRAQLVGGRRCEAFDTAALQLAQAELRLEADLDGALERDESDLFTSRSSRWPRIRLSDSRRWCAGSTGSRDDLPLEFAPLAEKTGLIVPLGKWDLREACRQLKEWQGSTPLAEQLWVSVISPASSWRTATRRGDRRCAARLRAGAAVPAPGVDRDTAMENPARCADAADADQSPWCLRQRGRLSHRLIRPRLSPPVSARLAEGRSLLRGWNRNSTEEQYGQASRRREHDDPAAGPANGGRGHRELASSWS